MPKFIGICGKARSGKDTLARFLADELEGMGVTVAIMSMAETMKDMLKPLLETVCPPWYDKYEWFGKCLNGEFKEQGIPELGGLSPRMLMQTLGTEWGRESLHEDLWLRVLQAKIDRDFVDFDYIIIPDVRYNNEGEYINNMVVHVTRPFTPDVSEHTSEDGVSEYLIDVEVVNDGGLDELAAAGRIIAEEVMRDRQ